MTVTTPSVRLSADSSEDIDARISELIESSGLSRSRNRFFRVAREATSVEAGVAFAIAYQWQSMTKSFMFTTLSSLGVAARNFLQVPVVDRLVLGAYQTAFKVIGDDLANFASEFSTVCPVGSDGIHYLWWEDTISKPLSAHVSPTEANQGVRLHSGVLDLMKYMDKLSEHPLGAAVQLRIVEAIALDIAVAFRRIFSKVDIDGVPLFGERLSLIWIDSHIRAETGHAQSVSDVDTGTVLMAFSPEEKIDFLQLSEVYIERWTVALEDLADLTCGLTTGQ